MSRPSPPKTPSSVLMALQFAGDVFPLTLPVPEPTASSLLAFVAQSPALAVLDAVERLQRAIATVALGCADGERLHPDHNPPARWLLATERRQLAVGVFKELDAHRTYIRASPRVWFKSSPIESLPDWYPLHLDALIQSHAGFDGLHTLQGCLDVQVSRTGRVAYSGVKRQTELVDACAVLMPHLGSLSRAYMMRAFLFAYADGAAKFSCA